MSLSRSRLYFFIVPVSHDGKPSIRSQVRSQIFSLICSSLTIIGAEMLHDVVIAGLLNVVEMDRAIWEYFGLLWSMAM